MTYQSPLPSPRILFLPFVLPSLTPLVAAADAKLVGNCDGMTLLKKSNYYGGVLCGEGSFKSVQWLHSIEGFRIFTRGQSLGVC